MADAISVGDGKYLYYVNDSIQGMGGKPFAHKPGKKLICTTEDQIQQQRNNGCLCNYQAVKVYRTFCYLDSQSVEVYKQGMCPKGINIQTYSAQDQPTQKKKAMVWKWCGWYEYVGCQGYPGGGGWTDPDIGTSLDKASKRQQTLCAPQYVGNKEYTHSVQQRLVTSYQCCTTDGGLQGCCRQVDSDSQGQKKCVTVWTISRQSPTAPWGSWQFQKKIGCVGQNAYLADKASLTTKIDVASCTSARGYSLTQCGTCSDSLLYTQFPPNAKPNFQCKYWVLYGASYIEGQQYCGWDQWSQWDWSKEPAPDQSIIKGVNGWAPQETSICKTSDGRKADKHLYQCKTKRVWHWKTFDTEQQKQSFNPTSIRKADNQKCKPCTQHKFQIDHSQKAPGARLNKGQQGAPCVQPQLPRSVIEQDKSCYDLYMYELSVENTDKQVDDQIGCIKRLSYKKKSEQSQQKDYKKLAEGKTQWQLLNTTYDNVLVLDNIGKTIKRSDSSWYFLRAVPCGEDPQQWNSDGAANQLPQDKQQVDTCIRAFMAGVYCVSDSTSPIIQNEQVVGYNKKPYVTSGECGKWKKLGTYRQQQIDGASSYDLTKTNQWQASSKDQKFQMVYIKTSTTGDVICDKLPDTPTSVYYRAKAIKLKLQCSATEHTVKGYNIAQVKWPQQAECISDAMQICSYTTPRVRCVYKDKQLKQPVARVYNYASMQYIVNGCQAYMCIGLQLQDTPFTSQNTCSTSYQKSLYRDAVSRIVFDNCMQYSVYTLYYATDPCLQSQQGIGYTDWSGVNMVGTQDWIMACSCDQQWAIQYVKSQLRKYPEGSTQRQLIDKLQINKIITMKKQDGTYIWYYLQATEIKKPQKWIDQDSQSMTPQRIAYLYMHNPFLFHIAAEKPDIHAHTVYGLTLMHLIPQCYVQSDSKIADYAGVYIGTKYDQQGDTCQTIDYQYCSQSKPVPIVDNYYLDKQCKVRCPHRIQSQQAVLMPPSDAAQLWYLAHVVTEVYAQGDQQPQVTCAQVTQQDQQIVKDVNIQWGGNNIQSLQQLIDCCPRYLFKYQYVIRAAANPCQAQGAATIQLAQDDTKTGWLSYQPVINGDRQWKDVDHSRTLIIGQPTCQAVSTQCQWDYPDCAAGNTRVVFSLSVVLNTPTIASTAKPWDFIASQCSTPNLSNYYIKLPGHQSYIAGTGAVFQWDVAEASIACGNQQSAWDNTQCNAAGHQFTYYASSPMIYGQCTGEGTVQYTSPRSLFPSMTHPAIPLAKWTMVRQYNQDRTTYTDSWGTAQQAVAYCGDALCQWSGQSCGATWTLQYTQLLDITQPPADSPQACWNQNAPSFQGCFAYRYTRKYSIQRTDMSDAVAYCLTYQNAGNQSSNWQLIPSQAVRQGWDSMACAQQHVYITTTMLTAQQLQQTPQQLFGVYSPAGPGYAKISATGRWSYDNNNGVGSLRITSFTAFQPSCTQQQASAVCDDGILQASACFSITLCPTSSSINTAAFLTAIQGLYTAPWARLTNTWSCAGGWQGWSFSTLECERGTDTNLNTVTCKQVLQGITLEYYTQGGLAAGPDTSRIPTPKKYWSGTYKWDPSSVAQHMLAKTTDHQQSSFRVTLQKASGAMSQYGVYCSGYSDTPVIGTCEANCAVCSKTERWVWYAVTDCSEQVATIPDTINATIQRTATVSYKQMVYTDVCTHTDSSGTQSSTNLTSSQIGTWIKIADGSGGQYTGTWRYYYVCNAPTTQPARPYGTWGHVFSRSFFSGQNYCDVASTVEAEEINLFVGGSGSGQRISVQPFNSRASTVDFGCIAGASFQFTVQGLSSSGSVLFTHSYSWGGGILDCAYGDYSGNYTNIYQAALGGSCGTVTKVKATFKTRADAARQYPCTIDNYSRTVGIRVNISNGTRSITNLSAYANAQASLQR